MDDFVQLKLELKTWEKEFRKLNGREAGRADIKNNTEIAQKYKKYTKIRANPPQQSHCDPNAASSTAAASAYPQTPPRKNARGVKRTASAASIADLATAHSNGNSGLISNHNPTESGNLINKISAKSSDITTNTSNNTKKTSNPFLSPPSNRPNLIPEVHVYQSPIKSSPSKRIVAMSPFSRAQKRMAGEHVPPTPLRTGKKSRSRNFFPEIKSVPDLDQTESSHLKPPPLDPTLGSDTEIDDTIAPTPVKNIKVFRPIFDPNSPMKKQKTSKSPKLKVKAGPRWDKMTQSTLINAKVDKQSQTNEKDIKTAGPNGVTPNHVQTSTIQSNPKDNPVHSSTSTLVETQTKSTKPSRKITARSKPNFATSKTFTLAPQAGEEYLEISSDDNVTNAHTSSKIKILPQKVVKPKKDRFRVCVPRQNDDREVQDLEKDDSEVEIDLESSDEFEEPTLFKSLHFAATNSGPKMNDLIDSCSEIPSELLDILSLESPIKNKTWNSKREQQIIKSLFAPQTDSSSIPSKIISQPAQNTVRPAAKRGKLKDQKGRKQPDIPVAQEVEADPFECMRLALTAEDIDAAAEADSELWNGEGYEDDDWADCAVGWGEESDDRLDASYV